MLIIAGHLVVPVAERDAYVAACRAVVDAARASTGCLDFSITADSLDPGQIRVYERWASDGDLVAFRGSGPTEEQQATIVGADVRRYTVSAVGEP